MNHSQITSFIWSIADLIRDSFKRGRYQDVILPLTVLRRIDQVLEPTKEKVLEAYGEYKDKLDNPDDLLRKAAGYPFYNTSRFTFERLVDDPGNIAANLRTYINSFSPNMREVIEKFRFDATIEQLDEAGLLFQVMERFKDVDLHPDRVSNPMMGTIFEELIRKFNEALNENPGEHFTPRDVVHLMVRLLLEGDEDRLSGEKPIVTVHDPCCGTGGMLTITKDVIEGSPKTEGINPRADVHLFGQEVNPETFAICKADLFIKGDGSDADNILYGSTLATDRHASRRNARVGTVDKFQGQEAPVAIYSTASSTPEDAPRGMAFLYSPNRLNVATSRARCLAVMVGSPALFGPECRSPRQMRWANGFCRLRELAE